MPGTAGLEPVAQPPRIAEARVRADIASAQFHEAQSKLDELNEQMSVLEAQVNEKQAELAVLRADLQDFAIDRYTLAWTHFDYIT